MNFQYYNPNGFKNIWISSDFHGWHKGLTKGVSQWEDKSGCRDFENENIMTEYIVKQINSVVEPQDVLCHLGDWTFSGKQNILRLREMINCKTIIGCHGNHDEWFLKEPEFQKIFEWYGHYNEFRKNKVLFCQFHFPLRTWNHHNKGAIALTAHQHHAFIYEDRQMDVGIDAPDRDYKPYHIDEIYDMMMLKPIKSSGHHKVGE